LADPDQLRPDAGAGRAVVAPDRGARDEAQAPVRTPRTSRNRAGNSEVRPRTGWITRPRECSLVAASVAATRLYAPVVGSRAVAELDGPALRQLPGAPVEEQVGGEEAVAAAHHLGHGSG